MKKSTMFLASAVAAVALFFSTNVNAQSSPKFGVGLNVGVPTATGGRLAIGADLRYQFDIDRQLSVSYTHLDVYKRQKTGFSYLKKKLLVEPV